MSQQEQQEQQVAEGNTEMVSMVGVAGMRVSGRVRKPNHLYFGEEQVVGGVIGGEERERFNEKRRKRMQQVQKVQKVQEVQQVRRGRGRPCKLQPLTTPPVVSRWFMQDVSDDIQRMRADEREIMTQDRLRYEAREKQYLDDSCALCDFPLNLGQAVLFKPAHLPDDFYPIHYTPDFTFF